MLRQAELAHIVFAVGVKTGADENHLWLEFFKARNPRHLDDFADVHAARVRRNRHVEHVGGRILIAAKRIERVLKNADHQGAHVACQNVFGTVAVVNVKINDGNTLQVVAL